MGLNGEIECPEEASLDTTCVTSELLSLVTGVVSKSAVSGSVCEHYRVLVWSRCPTCFGVFADHVIQDYTERPERSTENPVLPFAFDVLPLSSSQVNLLGSAPQLVHVYTCASYVGNSCHGGVRISHIHDRFNQSRIKVIIPSSPSIR